MVVDVFFPIPALIINGRSVLYAWDRYENLEVIIFPVNVIFR